jgi:hypothetical protein
LDKRISNIIALVITAVWATSFIADIISSNYEPSPYIHGIMMLVAGAAFGDSVIRRSRTDEHDEKSPPARVSKPRRRANHRDDY